MSIQKRIKRLEREQSDSMQPQKGVWNFARVSTKELIELRNLIDCDPGKAAMLKQKLVGEGRLKYEHQ